MPKRDMNDLLKKRMNATQQASEITVGDEAYETLFKGVPVPAVSRFCELPIDRLRPFFTADIGFHPYPPEKLKAFSQQLAEQGIYERVIVRPIPDSNDYEILAGHNRTRAWQMTGHDMIPAEVVSTDDARAVSIAVATNLLRRQDLTIIERGKAYHALLVESNRNGQRNAVCPTFGDSRQRLAETDDGGTSGEDRQKYNARKLVADFFGVTEYEIRKAIKLASLIGPLADILEDTPRKLPIACAELIADYDAATQQAFVEMCSIEGYTLNKATVQKITRTCPPPSVGKQEIYAVWRQARAEEAQRRAAPSKKISFDRRKFAPYCAIVVPYRVRIVIPASEMWESGNERPDYVLQNMVGASIDLVIIKVEREAGFAIGSRRLASRSQRYFFAHREDLHRIGSRVKCRMLAVGPRRCLVDCYGHDLDLTQREMRYAAIPDLRDEYHPGMELESVVKVYDSTKDELIISVKETETNPILGAEQRHPVGSRRLAVISGKYGGGVFCNLPDGVVCMCNYSFQHEDSDFMVGENVMLVVQRYNEEKLQMFGKILSKW